jgi:hypothetical protein
VPACGLLAITLKHDQQGDEFTLHVDWSVPRHHLGEKPASAVVLGAA